jgi:hypothetical protein
MVKLLGTVDGSSAQSHALAVFTIQYLLYECYDVETSYF